MKLNADILRGERVGWFRDGFEASGTMGCTLVTIRRFCFHKIYDLFCHYIHDKSTWIPNFRIRSEFATSRILVFSMFVYALKTIILVEQSHMVDPSLGKVLLSSFTSVLVPIIDDSLLLRVRVRNCTFKSPVTVVNHLNYPDVITVYLSQTLISVIVIFDIVPVRISDRRDQHRMLFLSVLCLQDIYLPKFILNSVSRRHCPFARVATLNLLDLHIFSGCVFRRAYSEMTTGASRRF